MNHSSSDLPRRSPDLGCQRRDPCGRSFDFDLVLEIPTPRWTAYDARYYGVQMPPEVPMTTQVRACTSPIWYTPGKRGEAKARSRERAPSSL